MAELRVPPRHAFGNRVRPAQEGVRAEIVHVLRSRTRRSPQHTAISGRVSMTIDRKIMARVIEARDERRHMLSSIWRCPVHDSCWSANHKHTIVVEAEARKCAPQCDCWRHWVTGVMGGGLHA